MQLGVLFCDQVGSTALLTRLGDALAEELRRDVFEALLRAADLRRGQVVKSSGDGLMVVFPAGAQDALACGELMLQAVARLARRELWADIRFKVGVSHGDVIPDDGDYYGAAVNLAARLCAAAMPNELLTTTGTLVVAQTRRNRWQARSALSLKGFPDPVTVSALTVGPEVAAAAPVAVPLDLQGCLPLVGRSELLERLENRWLSVRAGGCEFVSLVGEAGAGVTRCLAEFVGLLGRSAAVLYSDAATGIDWVAQLVRSHVAVTDLADLRTDAGEDAAALAAVCPLAGMRLQVTPLPGALADEDLLERLLRRIARRRPVVVVVDRMRPDTLRRLRIDRLMVVAGVRSGAVLEPEADTALLTPLDRSGVADMLSSVTVGGEAIPADVIDLVVAETGGVARDVVAVVDSLRRPTAANDPLTAVLDAVPYKGLGVFSQHDTARFYGRGRVVDDVLTAVSKRSFAMVVGSSGSGKSSVVRAGCIPHLARDGFAVIVMTPGDDPLRMLAAALSGSLDGGERQLLTDMQAGRSPLRRLEEQGKRLLVVVDQLEECFILGTSEPDRERFFRLISEPLSSVRILATLRGDFYSRAAESAALSAAVRSGTILIGLPDAAELRAMIEGPAAAAELRLEPGLVDLILADVSNRPGGLPLLSHALRETWRRRSGRSMTVAGYREAGGATGAIARTADTVYGQFNDAEKRTAKRIFLRLTALGEGVEDSRRRVPVEVLIAGETQESLGVLHRLTAARLVTADTDAQGRDVSELAHEALLREWPRLRDWLHDDRDELRTLAHLEAAAADWDSSGRPDSELYSERRLDTAEAIAADKLNDRERTYLRASLEQRAAQQRAEQRAKRRLQAFAAVLVVLLLTSTILGIFAARQRQSARREAGKARQQATLATARGLAAQAAALERTHPDTALLLSVEAQQLKDSTETRAGLLTVLSNSPHLARIAQAFGHDIFTFALSPDGRTAAVARADGSFRIYDFGTQRPLTPDIKVDSSPLEVHWLSDDVLATAWNDGVLSTWDGRSGRRLSTVRHQLAPGIHDIAFSSDGSMVAVSDSRDNVQIYRRSDLRLLSTVQGHAAASRDELAFNPAGSQLAVAGVGTLRIVDPSTGRQLAAATGLPTINLTGVSYSPDGTTVALGSAAGTVTLFDAATGRQRAQLNGHSDVVFRTAFSPDGHYLASTSQDGTVIVWRTSDDSMVGKPFIGHSGGRTDSIAFTPDSRQLVTAGPEAITWDIDARSALQHVNADEANPDDVLLDSPRHLLAIAGSDNRIQLWNSTDFSPIGSSPSLEGTLSDVAIDPGHGVLAAAFTSGSLPWTSGAGIDLIRENARLMTTPDYIGRLALSATPCGVSFNPSGDRLATVTCNGDLAVFDLRHANHLLFDIPVDSLGGNGVGWTADGSRLIVTGQSHYTIVDAGSHHVVAQSAGTHSWTGVPRQFPHNGPIEVAAFAGSIALIDRDGHSVKGAALDAAGVLAYSVISPNGTLLAATGDDGTLTVWSLVDDRRLVSELSLTEGITALTFVNNHELVLAGTRGTTDVVDLDPASQVRQACALVGRNLTPAELADYLPGVAYHKTCPQWAAG